MDVIIQPLPIALLLNYRGFLLASMSLAFAYCHLPSIFRCEKYTEPQMDRYVVS